MKYIAYHRVSTQEQGLEGLGIQSQRTIIQQYLKNKELIAEFTEVQSGAKKVRIELEKALNLCKLEGATLVVAKLDRLTRSLAHIITLRQSGVKFMCADNPYASEFEINLRVVFAEEELRRISERTKAALKVKKDAGIQLGSPQNLTHEGVLKSVEVRWDKAISNANNRRAKFAIEQLKSNKASYTLQQIADILNKEGFLTSRGLKFKPSQVLRLLNR